MLYWSGFSQEMKPPGPFWTRTERVKKLAHMMVETEQIQKSDGVTWPAADWGKPGQETKLLAKFPLVILR